MDPLSIAASIASLVTIAGTTASIIEALYGELESRPAILLGISQEISVFCSVLGHVEQHSVTHGKRSAAGSELASAIANCMETFKQIGVLLSALRPRKSSVTKRARQLLWMGKMRDMGRLRNDLERHKATLLIALYALQSEER
jgi:hypothetical protein